jgi:hypothetical protein
VAVITSSQYHALVASVVLTLVTSGICLLLSVLPRARRPGQLPWRRWHRLVPARHAAVLAVLREDYRAGRRPGTPGREIERRSGTRCAPAVLRRMCETGWAERISRPGRTSYHMSRTGYRLTPAGWAGTAMLPGAHLAGEIAMLEDQVTELIERQDELQLPPGHPSGPIAQACTPESPSWSGSWPRTGTGGR